MLCASAQPVANLTAKPAAKPTQSRGSVRSAKSINSHSHSVKPGYLHDYVTDWEAGGEDGIE